MLSLLWIIPVSLGITWLGYRVLQVGYLIVEALFGWLWSPTGQRALDRWIGRAVWSVTVLVGLVIVLRVATV